jgi:hypothetical protein
MKVVKEDCMSCRVTGFLTFSGLTAYILHAKTTIPVSNKRYQLFLTCFALGTGTVAITRALPSSAFTSGKED